MSFEWPLALLGVPIAAAVIAWVLWRGDRTAERPWYRPVRPQGPLLLFGLGLLLVTGSLARPIAEISVPRIEGRVVIAVDNSSSMLALDEDPSRIGAAQTVARRIVEAQGPTTAVGLVTFSSGGVVLQAPTTDHRLVSDAIDRLGGYRAREQLLEDSIHAPSVPWRLYRGDCTATMSATTMSG